MEKLLGANWRTTVSGIGAGISSLLAVLSTISLTPEGQAVVGFLSPSQKTTVAVGSAVAALAFKFWNSLVQKDRNVTGGTTQQTSDGARARDTSTSVLQTIKADPKT